MLTLHRRIAISPPSVGWLFLLGLCSIGVLGGSVFRFGAPLILTGLLALALLALFLARPELATLSVLFILYANLADVAYQFHGVPKPIAASVALLLGIPLASFVVLQRKKLIIDRVFVLMCVFFVFLNVSALFAKDSSVAVSYIVDYLTQGMILYFLVVNVVRELPTLKRAIWALLLAGSLMGGVSLFQKLTHTQSNNYGGLAQVGGVFAANEIGSEKVLRLRSAGPIGEKNRYAQILLVLVPLALLRFWGERSRILRLIALMTAALTLSGVMLTFSRGAFVGLVLIVLVMTYMRYLRLRQVLASSGLFVLLLVFAAPDLVVRIQSLGALKAFFSDTTEVRPDHAMRGRFAENVAALEVFLEAPILGVGPGQFAPFYSTSYVNRLGVVNQARDYRAHNLYLELAAETGLVGFTCFMAIVLSTGLPLWRMSRGLLTRWPDLANLAVTFLLSNVGYLATGVFLQLAFPRYFWLLIALSSAAGRIIRLEAGRREALEEQPDIRSATCTRPAWCGAE